LKFAMPVRTLIIGLVFSAISGAVGVRETSARMDISDCVVRQWRTEARVQEAARVYRRAGCGDRDLAVLTAEWAHRRGLLARVIAAQVFVESSCNPRTVSLDGSVGLMQVRVKTWRREFGLGPAEMLDPSRSLEVGTEILRRHVSRFGLRKGLERYNGRGSGARLYARKVLTLAQFEGLE